MILWFKRFYRRYLRRKRMMWDAEHYYAIELSFINKLLFEEIRQVRYLMNSFKEFTYKINADDMNNEMFERVLDCSLKYYNGICKIYNYNFIDRSRLKNFRIYYVLLSHKPEHKYTCELYKQSIERIKDVINKKKYLQDKTVIEYEIKKAKLKNKKLNMEKDFEL